MDDKDVIIARQQEVIERRTRPIGELPDVVGACARRQGTLGGIMARQRPDVPSAEPERILLVSGIVIESFERSTTVVGGSSSGRFRLKLRRMRMPETAALLMRPTQNGTIWVFDGAGLAGPAEMLGRVFLDEGYSLEKNTGHDATYAKGSAGKRMLVGGLSGRLEFTVHVEARDGRCIGIVATTASIARDGTMGLRKARQEERRIRGLIHQRLPTGGPPSGADAQHLEELISPELKRMNPPLWKETLRTFLVVMAAIIGLALGIWVASRFW